MLWSSGMINLSNRGASRNAIKFGRKYGIDMSVHRSTWIGEIEENNTIFVVLDKKGFTQLSSRLKNTNSLFMLAPHEIVDPCKTDERIFEEVFSSITETLKGLTLNNEKIKLGVHYHTPYKMVNGKLMTSGIFGVFLDSLAEQVDLLYCFLHGLGH